MKKNERKLGVVLTYANIFLNTAVVLLFTPILINYLGNSGFGLYSLALTILTYIALLDFGFGNSIIVFTSKYRASKESERQKSLYASILVAYIALSVFASFALYVFYINIESNFSSGMSENEIELFKIIFIIISFNIIFSIPLNLYKSILTAYERFGFIKLASLIRTLLTPLLLCISIAFNIDVVGIVLIISVVNFLVLFSHFLYYYSHIQFSFSIFDFKLNELKKSVRYSFFIFLALIVDQVNWNFGQFLLGAYIGSESVAIYAVAILINMTFLLLSSAVSNVLLPKITKMVELGACNDELTGEMIKVGRLQAYIIFSVLFGFLLLGKDFIHLWAGRDYTDAYYLTLLLMLPLCIPLVQNLGLSILQARNKFAFRAISSFVVSVLTVCFSILLTKKFSYWGLASAISIAFFVLNGLVMNIYYHFFGIKVASFWYEIFKIIGVIAISCVPVLIIKSYFQVESLFDLILLIIIMILIILVFSYKFAFNIYEKKLFLKGINLLKPHLS